MKFTLESWREWWAHFTTTPTHTSVKRKRASYVMMDNSSDKHEVISNISDQKTVDNDSAGTLWRPKFSKGFLLFYSCNCRKASIRLYVISSKFRAKTALCELTSWLLSLQTLTWDVLLGILRASHKSLMSYSTHLMRPRLGCASSWWFDSQHQGRPPSDATSRHRWGAAEMQGPNDAQFPPIPNV